MNSKEIGAYIADINTRAQIAFGIALIVGILAYIAFFK